MSQIVETIRIDMRKDVKIRKKGAPVSKAHRNKKAYDRKQKTVFEEE